MPIDFVTLALAKQMIGGDGGEGGSVKIDTTLTKKGVAADAKATGEAINKKAGKPLIINADNAPNTGTNSPSGIPVFIIDYTPSELKKYADDGSRVIVVRYNRHYEMYEATEQTAKFRFIEATDVQVEWYHAVLNTDKTVVITRTTHKSCIETTTGGSIGQIPCIKNIDGRGYVSSWSFMDKQDIVDAVLEALPNGDEVSY